MTALRLPTTRLACLARKLIATAMVAGTSVAAHATDLRLLSSFNSTQKPTFAVLERYLANVKALSNGGIRISVAGPEVVPIFEQLQPVSSGAFDMLYTHPVFHSGNGSLALTVDAMAVDPALRRSSGVWDAVDSFYQKKHKLKLVAMMSVSNEGYHLFTKQPLSPAGDLAGRKIRGTPTYFGVIEALGAQPVVLPGSEIYSALQTGVIDGAGWPAAGMVSMRHYEVAKYRLRPTFGAATQPVFLNLDRWNKLDAKTQQVLLEAGKKTELEMPALGDAIQDEEDAELNKRGVQVVQMNPATAAKVRKAFVDSIWKLGADCCRDEAAALRAMAIKAGLTQ
jgi:TRAP-type C4-dicarboxylate transport system substrate-binding protein